MCTSSRVQDRLRQWRAQLGVVVGTTGIVVAATTGGLFQMLEAAMLDWYIQHRPLEAPDPRLVLITIDDDDVRRAGEWPLSDEQLAVLLEQVRSQQPRVLGLHLYREVPIPPGSDRLSAVLATTPNLIGLEKYIGQSVPPPPILQQLNQVGLADMVMDPDGVIRRGLVSVRGNDGRIRNSFAAALALMYLQAEDVPIEPQGSGSSRVQLGKTLIESLRQNDGGYAQIDDGGYQVILNYRGTQENFETVSMTEVLAGEVPDDLFRDRIAMIGLVTPTYQEHYNTPYSNRVRDRYTQMSGLLIHANLTSQLVSAALDGRSMIRFPSPVLEWIWVFGWASAGTLISWYWWQTSQFRNHKSPAWGLLSVYLGTLCLILPVIGYVAFIKGCWVPVISPISAALMASFLVSLHNVHRLQKLATCDGLTQLGNRRYFDLYLERLWSSSLRRQQPISLILCDVDYFKPYNDTYGHRQGDDCLQQIAQALSLSVRSGDVVARYGGEEFAIILPDTSVTDAMMVARRLNDRVRHLQLGHKTSDVAPYVTLSCGVAHLIPQWSNSPRELIEAADYALYEAKEKGRNTCVLRQLPEQTSSEY
ncbi:diguanylate cyclase [Phormidium yuhuli AB48]|uniref:Diguanylate cyclase n=1 Tax=Phormidium yuhuli AB48 TaxID=2940671 RepID=A0ABY5AQS3_9CYAN|nr:CHASE2 domain-containing protein [Phormidium yuhuli]USR91192.1 diguanylate cyclase [Phormidium yuhuli AB48]